MWCRHRGRCCERCPRIATLDVRFFAATVLTDDDDLMIATDITLIPHTLYHVFDLPCTHSFNCIHHISRTFSCCIFRRNLVFILYSWLRIASCNIYLVLSLMKSYITISWQSQFYPQKIQVEPSSRSGSMDVKQTQTDDVSLDFLQSCPPVQMLISPQSLSENPPDDQRNKEEPSLTLLAHDLVSTFVFHLFLLWEHGSSLC